MAEPASLAWNLGFLTVLQEATGYLGGYLVTNHWGRPLEFRLSTTVQPNRVQQILYGETLEPFLCADLIGKTLVAKTATPVQLIVTDKEAALELRWRVDVPVTLLRSDSDSESSATGNIHTHPHFPQDRDTIKKIMDQLQGAFHPAEPFARIRQALAEARKMGVTCRA